MKDALILPFVVPLFTLVGLFGAWIYYALRSPWPRATLTQGRLYRCAACGHVYAEARDVPMARCPSCDRFNEAVRR